MPANKKNDADSVIEKFENAVYRSARFGGTKAWALRNAARAELLKAIQERDHKITALAEALAAVDQMTLMERAIDSGGRDPGNPWNDTIFENAKRSGVEHGADLKLDVYYPVANDAPGRAWLGREIL